MKFLHIDNSKSDIAQFNKYVEQGKHVFVLIFMVGCGPCSQTIPKWKHIESVLKKQYANNDDVVVADINKDMSSFIKHIGAIEGYPTMKYIGNKGGKVEPYEESKIPVKDRSTDSFIKWIETKIDRVIANKPQQQTTKRRHRRGGNIILGGYTSNNRKRNNRRRRRTRKYGGAIIL
jgi:hypothetical protein